MFGSYESCCQQCGSNQMMDLWVGGSRGSPFKAPPTHQRCMNCDGLRRIQNPERIKRKGDESEEDKFERKRRQACRRAGVEEAVQ